MIFRYDTSGNYRRGMITIYAGILIVSYSTIIDDSSVMIAN